MNLPAWCERLVPFPSEASLRLYECAKREQWRVDGDIDWDSIGLVALAPEIRRAMACIYTQLQYGEVFGLTQTARSVGRMSPQWARLIGATQVMDEARHVEFFSRVLVSLGEEASVSKALVAFAEEVASGTDEEAFLGTQIMLEGFAQSVFVEGTLLARKAASRAIRLPGTDGALRLLETIGRFVGRDEARHVAFGVLYFRDLWSRLPARQRADLQLQVDRWSEMLRQLLTELGPQLALLGVSKRDLSARIERNRAAQLRNIGFDGYTGPPAGSAADATRSLAASGSAERRL